MLWGRSKTITSRVGCGLYLLESHPHGANPGRVPLRSRWGAAGTREVRLLPATCGHECYYPLTAWAANSCKPIFASSNRSGSSTESNMGSPLSPGTQRRIDRNPARSGRRGLKANSASTNASSPPERASQLGHESDAAGAPHPMNSRERTNYWRRALPAPFAGNFERVFANLALRYGTRLRNAACDVCFELQSRNLCGPDALKHESLAIAEMATYDFMVFRPWGPPGRDRVLRLHQRECPLEPLGQRQRARKRLERRLLAAGAAHVQPVRGPARTQCRSAIARLAGVPHSVRLRPLCNWIGLRAIVASHRCHPATLASTCGARG